MAVTVQHINKYLWQWPCCLLLFLGLPNKLFAQKDTSTKKLKQVNVRSAALPQAQGLTPSQSISASDFDRYNALTVADAVRDFAGVNLKDYGGIGGLKTVSVRGFGAGHTAILYDGVEISDAQNGQIDLSKLNLNGIQQVTLYNAQPAAIVTPARSFASASVIAINPVEPNLSVNKPYQVLLGLNGGSFGLINPFLQWQQRISDRWSFAVNSYLENANGKYSYKNVLNDSTETRNNAGVSEGQADGSLYWIKNDSNKFALHVNYYNSDRGLPSAVVPVSHEKLWNRNIFAQSGYQHTWNDGFNLLINTKLSQEFTRYSDPDFLNNQGGIDDQFTQREIYQSVALGYHITQNWEIAYASDVAYSSLGAFSPIGTIYKYASPSRLTLLNVLASKLSLGKWLFQGSLLHTDVTEWVKVGTATPAKAILLPTIMASFMPSGSPDLQLRAFYKDIFREPTFDEQYFFATNGSRNLKPEFARQYDLGITYRKVLDNFFDYLTVTVDGYYNAVTNKIVAVPNQNLVISTITNLGKVRIEGTDIGLKTATRQSDGWRGVLSVNYTYQYAVDVDLSTPQYYLQQIAYTPKNTFSLNAGADYKQMGLYFNQVLSSSRYYLGQSNPENYIDGYGVSDVSFIYKFLAGNKPAVLSAHLNNLFDENYQIVRSFPMSGRSFLLSFQITF